MILLPSLTCLFFKQTSLFSVALAVLELTPTRLTLNSRDPLASAS